MRKSIIPLILLLLNLGQVMAFAEMVLVPQTGQTTSYAERDDGNTQMGVAWPNPRFTDNNNGTITDNLTGLVWLKNANCFGTKTWSATFTSVNGLSSGACGLTDGSNSGDWRLPNRKELKSLINRQRASSAEWLNGEGFSNVQAYYWSSSTIGGDNTGYAWIVTMIGDLASGIKSGAFSMWPVRGGQ